MVADAGDDGADAGERIETPKAKDDRPCVIREFIQQRKNGAKGVFRGGEPVEHIQKHVLGKEAAGDFFDQCFHADILSGQGPVDSKARRYSVSAVNWPGGYRWCSFLLSDFKVFRANRIVALPP